MNPNILLNNPELLWGLLISMLIGCFSNALALILAKLHPNTVGKWIGITTYCRYQVALSLCAGAIAAGLVYLAFPTAPLWIYIAAGFSPSFFVSQLFRYVRFVSRAFRSKNTTAGE
jgi:TctA family transporter